MRIAVIGHVEHIVLGRVPAVPAAGQIAHVEGRRTFAGGGGGVAFFQLTKSPAEVLLYTALGDDEAARQVEAQLRETEARSFARPGARIFAARRPEPHTRDVVLITPDGERTIIVVGEPLHPRAADALPWDLLASCDAAYFTAQDPAALQAARAARLLIVSARRKAALDASAVRADVVVGSVLDEREAWPLREYAQAPGALVLTEGARGGSVHTGAGVERFAAPAVAKRPGGAYGAGDSFAGALVYFLAAGIPVAEACARAGEHGAAVLGGLDPLVSQKAIAG